MKNKLQNKNIQSACFTNVNCSLGIEIKTANNLYNSFNYDFTDTYA